MSKLRLLAVLIPMLLAAGCDRGADDTATTTPPPAAPATTPATPPPAEPAMAPAPMPAASGASARVMLQPTEGHAVSGELTLRAEGGGLVISGHVNGLTANAEHGFHVHAVGDCSAPDASSAGEHFAAEGETHGRAGTGSHHAGDMPNLRADADGHAMVEARVERLELGTGGPLDAANRAIVVHQNPDDYVTQPAGNSGARVACGVITLDGGATGTAPATAPATDPAAAPTPDAAPAAADPAGDTD